MKMIKEEATHRTGEVMLEEIGLMSRDTELSTYVQYLLNANRRSPNNKETAARRQWRIGIKEQPNPEIEDNDVCPTASRLLQKICLYIWDRTTEYKRAILIFWLLLKSQKMLLSSEVYRMPSHL